MKTKHGILKNSIINNTKTYYKLVKRHKNRNSYNNF